MIKLKKIKFSEDYEKLPNVWAGTQATLIAVYPESVERIKNRYTSFWHYDTKVRGQDKHYPLTFTDAIILVFIHHNTGRLFPTIRRNYKEKFEYYVNSLGESFVLTNTRGDKC